jgi:hypothetical protein
MQSLLLGSIKIKREVNRSLKSLSKLQEFLLRI